MRTWLSFYRQMLLNLVAARVEEGDAVAASPSSGRKLPTWAIILIVVVALGICAGGACLLVPVILTLLGPSIGNVFSNMIEEMGTPVP